MFELWLIELIVISNLEEISILTFGVLLDCKRAEKYKELLWNENFYRKINNE